MKLSRYICLVALVWLCCSPCVGANKLAHIEDLIDQRHDYAAIEQLDAFLSVKQSKKDYYKAQALRQFCYYSISHYNYSPDSLRSYRKHLPLRYYLNEDIDEILNPQYGGNYLDFPTSSTSSAKHRRDYIYANRLDSVLHYARRTYLSPYQRLLYYKEALPLIHDDMTRMIVHHEMGELTMSPPFQPSTEALGFYSFAAEIAEFYIQEDSINKAIYLPYIVDAIHAQMRMGNNDKAAELGRLVSRYLMQWWGVTEWNAAQYIYRASSGDLEDINVRLYRTLIKYYLYMHRLAILQDNNRRQEQLNRIFTNAAQLFNCSVYDIIGYSNTYVKHQLSSQTMIALSIRSASMPNELHMESSALAGYRNIIYYYLNDVFYGMGNKDADVLYRAFSDFLQSYRQFYSDQLASDTPYLLTMRNTFSSGDRQTIHSMYFEEMFQWMMLAAYASNDERLRCLAYDFILFNKQVLRLTDQQLYSGSQPTDLMQQRAKLKYAFANAATETLRDSLLNEITIIERQLTPNAPDCKALLQVDYKAISHALNDDEAAVEFVSVPDFFDGDGYVTFALLLQHDAPSPTLCRLKDAQIDDMCRQPTDSAGIAAVYFGSNIYWKTWLYIPTDSKVHTIYYATTGQLERVAIENTDCLILGVPTNYITQYCRLSSTRQILSLPAPKFSEAYLYGDLAYRLSLPTMQQLSLNSKSRTGTTSLEHSRKELRDIQAILQQNHVSYRTFDGKSGTEASFLALSGHSPHILHISTHGIVRGATPYDPMEQYGLLMSGAARALEGKPLPEDVEDGILTAAEIATMDLSGTELVVLSACETALGDITSEGVWGLQRAFKMAGVQTIVMSLWQVDDEATATLMQYFYEELFRLPRQHFSAHLALSTAQHRMRQHPKFSSPYFWAAFIAVD